jgi:D-alanyl-D-alanine carboxypeptidase
LISKEPFVFYEGALGIANGIPWLLHFFDELLYSDSQIHVKVAGFGKEEEKITLETMKNLFFLLLITAAVSAQAGTKAASTLIYDQNNGEILTCDNCNVPRPIASLTKIMTALVALEHNSDFSKPVFVGQGSKIPPGINTRGDLFTAMLVRSDNKAAELLAEDYPGGRKAFIRAMNAKARSLGMEFTRFVDPSGLGSGNIANIGEINNLIKVASLQPIIADTSVLPQVEIKNKKYKVLLDNTNKMLLAEFHEIKFSKTGFTNASGWSVGMILERQGQRFIVIVLGARDKVERYNLAKDMIQERFADIEHTETLEQKDISIWDKILKKIFN